MTKPGLFVCVIGLLAGAFGAPASAGSDSGPVDRVIASVRDARGDVARDEDGLSARQRASIDLWRLRMEQTPKGPRFIIRLRQFAVDEPFSQNIFINLGTFDDDAFGQILLASNRQKHRAVLEGGPRPEGYAECRVRSRVSQDLHTISVTVPPRCVPHQPTEVRLLGYTTTYEDDSQQVYSRDRLNAGRRVDLTPADTDDFAR